MHVRTMEKEVILSTIKLFFSDMFADTFAKKKMKILTIELKTKRRM